MPPSQSEPNCTCTFSEHGSVQFDSNCFYHGDNGTMVTYVNKALFAPTHPIRQVLARACPCCGRARDET